MNAHAALPEPGVLDARAERARLDRATQLASRLAERRDAAVAREAGLVRQVGLAKGRLAARKDVEAVLDELQARQNRRNLGTFESLLTAFVQEVLPGQPPIRLELGTERNLPALDILAETATGHREDVYDDQGGAVTNVLSAGLRLIAVVKSRSALFVALDEADCWIKPSRAPAFYRVLEDAASRLSVQCLAISHHDIETFGADIHVSRLEGTPGDEAGVAIQAPEPAPAWPDPAAKGLRYIRLLNVQGYVDQTMLLGPGVNALVGENNNGKSTLARALRAVFFGETRDSLVRHGAKRCAVEIGVENGRVLRFQRTPRATPVNTWSLHEPDGSVVEEGGQRYETGDRSVPPWVGRLFGIAPIQDLEVHIAHQKKPVFLLGDSPSRRASVLSVGQEADYARMMIRIQKERCASDSTDAKEGEREIADVRRLTARLEGVDGKPEAIASLAARLDALASEQSETAARAAVLDGLASARAALQKAHARAFLLQELPEPGRIEALAEGLRAGKADEATGTALGQVLDAWHAAHARAEVLDALPAAMPVIQGTQALAETGNALRLPRRNLAKARARSATLAGLPETIPQVERTDADAAVLGGLCKAGLAANAARAVATRVAREEAEARAKMERLLESTGGHCPACGQDVASAEALLQGHAHP